MKVDIITCTYNRGNLLKELYKSLIKQTCNKFTWIIIDDGSEDNTKDIVEKFMEEEKIKIEYYKIKNSGKHIALNKAIEVSKNELFFIVDSDDILIENSIEEIIIIEKTIENKKEFCGLAGIKATFEGKNLTNELKQNVIDANSIDAIYKYNLFGDKAEVFYTSILKRYRFPQFEGEKFITESVIWNKMANDGYKIRWFNKIIYLAEYREDGLTQNSFRLAVKNPKGKSYHHNLESTFNIPLKWRMYHQINYFRYGFIAKNNVIELIRNSRKKIFIPISIPIALVGSLHTFYKCKKMNIKLT